MVEQMDIVDLLHAIQAMYPFPVGSITISLKFVLWYFPILVCSSVCLSHLVEVCVMACLYGLCGMFHLPSRYVPAGKTYCRNGPHSKFEGNIILAQAVETFERSHPALCIFIVDMVSSQAGYDT
jgi:hypothetical protein